MTLWQKIKYGSAATLAIVSGVAHAALDASVTTAINDSKTDILALGALVFGIMIAVKIYHWLRRAL